VVAVAVVTLTLLLPDRDAPAYYPSPPETILPDRIPQRLIVKVRPESLKRSGKSAAVDVTDIEEKTQHLGSPHISPLVAPAVFTGLSAAAAKSHPAARVYVFDFPDRVNLDSTKAHIEGLPWVEYAEYDRLMQLFDTPDDPLFPWQWGLENTGQTIPVIDRLPGDFNDTIAWVGCTPGFDVDFNSILDHPGPRAPVIVGILDTGSDTQHEDLSQNLWRNPGEIPDNGIDDDRNGYVDDYFGYDFSGDELLLPNELIPDSDPTDTIGHGTHVAGIVAAVTGNARGIAGLGERTRIMTLKIFPNARNSVVAQAIYYGVDNGVDILNMSFGGKYPSKTISDALLYARSRGVLAVAAAGNTGDETQNYPSADTAVIAVGALDYLGHMAPFSTFGGHLDLVAPGVSILSLRAAGTDLYLESKEPDVHIIAERYYLADGTSMAAPYVTGCAAALLSIEAGLSPERLTTIIKSSCMDIVDPRGTGEPYPGWDRYSGHGLIDLGQAINELAGVTLRISSPHEGDVLAGTVVIEGTASGSAFSAYQLDYGVGENPGSWQSLASSADPIIDETIYTWQTAGLTGTYTLRLRAPSGHEDRVTIMLANSALTHISSPQNGDTISLVQVISGSSVAPDYECSVVSFAPQENPEDTTTIWVGTVPMVDDSICAWTVGPPIEGWHYLKLTTPAAAGTLSDSVLVFVKNPFHPGWPVSIPAHAFFTPAAADLDRDGKMEFIVPTLSGLYVFEDDGTVAPGWPRDTLTNFGSIPAIADLDQDGLYEIIIASEDYLHVYTFIGEQYSFWPREFSGRLNLYGLAIALVCDLDGEYYNDGSPEILVIDYGGTIRAFNDDGSEYEDWEANAPLIVDVINTSNTSLPRATVIDMDRDGQNELIVAGDGIWIWHARTGAPYHYADPQIRDYKATDGMAVGNFDSDDELEIAVVYMPLGSQIWQLDVLQADGMSLSGWPVSTGISDELYLLNSLSAGDVDGDGLPEIFIVAYFMGGGYILAYRADGTPLLTENPDGRFFELSGTSSAVSLTDVTGDGQPEIVIKAGQFFFGDEYLCALTPDGEFVPGYPLRFGYGIGALLAAPLTTDLDGDGLLNMFTLESSGQVVTAWDLPDSFTVAGRPWPKFRRDNWNSGVLPSFPLHASGYHQLFVVRLIGYLFKEKPPFPPYEPSDFNCDGKTSLSDLVILVNYVYRTGQELCIP